MCQRRLHGVWVWSSGPTRHVKTFRRHRLTWTLRNGLLLCSWRHPLSMAWRLLGRRCSEPTFPLPSQWLSATTILPHTRHPLVDPHAGHLPRTLASMFSLLALCALRNGWTTGEGILRISEHLPSSLRDFQAHVGEDGSRSCLFTTGAFVYGHMAGVTLNATGLRYVSAALAAVIRSVAPGTWFSSASITLNVRSGVHRDLNNFPSIENTLVPLTCFGRGELWLADSSGDHVLEGTPGR